MSFKAFRRFNHAGLESFVGARYRLSEYAVEHFPGEGLPDRLARELARRRSFPVKELFESFEFFERVRRRLRAPEMADLCCGHGLTGLLFAVFESRVERVTLLDHRRPPSYDRVLEAVTAVAPWAAEKVRYVEKPLAEASGVLGAGCSVLGVHACGVRTDRCLEAALAVKGKVAVMPCCYAQTARSAPRWLRRAVPAEVATDILRSYRLEAAGYEVDWSAIPRDISEKNRILIGLPPDQTTQSARVT